MCVKCSIIIVLIQYQLYCPLSIKSKRFRAAVIASWRASRILPVKCRWYCVTVVLPQPRRLRPMGRQLYQLDQLQQQQQPLEMLQLLPLRVVTAVLVVLLPPYPMTIIIMTILARIRIQSPFTGMKKHVGISEDNKQQQKLNKYILTNRNYAAHIKLKSATFP